MGKYRATLNMAGCKRGQIAEFDDTDPSVVRMVLDGHLIPTDITDEARKRIYEARSIPEAPAPTSIEAVREALKAARERAGVVVPEDSSEAAQEASGGLSEALKASDPEDPEEALEDADLEPETAAYFAEESVKTTPKKRSGNTRRSS